MSRDRAIFALLLEEDNPATDDALLAALHHADEPTARAVIRTLMARGKNGGPLGLVSGFHELSQPLQELVLEFSEEISRVLREAVQSRNEQVRLNVLEIIRRVGLYSAAYLVETALHDRSAHVRQVAADSLYALADHFFTQAAARLTDASDLSPEALQQRTAELEPLAGDRKQLASAILSGLMAFNIHHQPLVVEAAMWMVDDLGSKFWAAISATGSKAARVAMNIFDDSKDPRMIPFAIAAMTHAEFRPHVVKGLGTCDDPVFLAEWFRQCWRITEPKIVKCMSALKELACIQERAAMLLELPADAQRHVPRLFMVSSVPLDAKIYILKEMHRRGDPETRSAALWALMSIHDERTTNLLQVIGGEGDTESSRQALFELARRHPERYKPEMLLNPHRKIAAGQTNAAVPEQMNFDTYWSMFDQLAGPDRIRLGKEMLEHTSRAPVALAQHLSQADPAERIRALRIIVELGLAEGFSDRIYALSYDPQAEVRSAAVMALGRLGDMTSRLILNNALLDPDTRVQANAVEAIELLGGRINNGEMQSKLASADNRVRANAVKALLKMGVREAAEALVRMLQDKNRAHRVSALWLVEQMGLFTLINRISMMADEDDDPQVRTRAKALANRLTHSVPNAMDAEEKQEVVPSTS